MRDLIFASASDEAGWNPETQVQILLEYIGNQNSDSAFEDFLKEKVASEKEMGNDSNS